MFPKVGKTNVENILGYISVYAVLTKLEHERKSTNLRSVFDTGTKEVELCEVLPIYFASCATATALGVFFFSKKPNVAIS